MPHPLLQMCDRYLRDGMHVHVASTMSRPNALLVAMARMGMRRGHRYTVSCNAFHAHMHALTAAGVVAEAITGFAGDTYPTPRPRPQYARVPWSDPFPLQEWSLLSLSQRLHAGATGRTGAITTSLAGSDLEAPLLRRGVAERSHDGALEIAALRPDLTILHAAAADERGNLYLTGPLGEGVWGALASRLGVVATTEVVVDRPPAGLTQVPSERVLAVKTVRGGAHPQGMTGIPSLADHSYPDDYAYLRALDGVIPSATHGRAARNLPDPTLHRRHVTEHLHQAPLTFSHPGLLTPARVLDRGPSPRQRHAIMAARAIRRVVVERGHERVFTGIGLSHVAAWLAARWLRSEENVAVSVDNELGMLGLDPGSGDPFLFGQANVQRCAGFTDVLGAIGGHSAGRRTLAVLSAGEVDPSGALNSSRDAQGRFLVGSGGANDFGSRGDVLLVARLHARRFVDKVSFVTTPGHHVLDIATQHGHLHRTSGEAPFGLRSWAPTAEAPEPSTVLSSLTGWDVNTAEADLEPPICDQERRHLHAIDPEGIYA